MSRLPRPVVVLVPALVLLGITAEWVLYGPDAPGLARRDELSLALIDLLTGWTVAASGLVAWFRRPGSRTGPLLVGSGAAWFLSNFAAADVAVLATLAIWLEQLYRAPLMHAILTFPSGRVASGGERGAVAIAWGVCLLPALWKDPIVSTALGIALAGWCWLGARRARRSALGRPRIRLVAATMLGLAFALPAVWGALGRGALDASGALVFQAAYVGSAVLLAAALLRRDRTATRLTQVVVELGDGPEPSLRATLARLLSDPTLAVGIWDAQRGIYVDEQGRAVDPSPPPGRAATPVPSGAAPGALLIHDAGLLDDAALTEALAAAASLQTTNERLRGELRTQVDGVARSRHRLLAAEAEERIRLSERLEHGALRTLRELDEPLRVIASGALRAGGEATAEATMQVQAQLVRTVDELSSLARGLRPQTLTSVGLRGALAEVAIWSSAAVDMDIETDGLPRGVEDEAWYVCAEALTNVERHSRAARVAVRIRPQDGWLAVDVEDDGVGGADMALGGGLEGLRRRIEAAGGKLTVVSPPLGGTCVRARLPLGIAASNRSDRDDLPACTDVPPAVPGYGEAPIRSPGGTT